MFNIWNCLTMDLTLKTPGLFNCDTFASQAFKFQFCSVVDGFGAPDTQWLPGDLWLWTQIGIVLLIMLLADFYPDLSWTRYPVDRQVKAWSQIWYKLFRCCFTSLAMLFYLPSREWTTKPIPPKGKEKEHRRIFKSAKRDGVCLVLWRGRFASSSSWSEDEK